MVKTAVIVAPDSTGLQPVFGIPAVRRLVILSRQLGIGSIHVTGKVKECTPILSDLLPSHAFHAVEEPNRLDEVVRRLGLGSEEKALVLSAGHAVDRHTLSGFLQEGENGTVSVMVPRREGRAGDRIYIASSRNLLPVLRAVWSSDASGLETAERGEKLRYFQGVDGLPHAIDPADTKGSHISEVRLLAALSTQTKADDGLMARYIDRRISQLISARLAHTRITPNQITLIGMTIGLFGAWLLSLPGYLPHLIGSLLFVFCIIVDGVDGEVARLKLQTSRLGHYLDVITDNIVHVAIFAGIGLGLYHDTGNRLYIWMLWLMLGGLALCIVAVYQCILKKSQEELERSPTALRMMALASNRDFAYLVAVLAVVDRLEWFLIGASIGSYVFAGLLCSVSICEKHRGAVA